MSSPNMLVQYMWSTGDAVIACLLGLRCMVMSSSKLNTCGVLLLSTTTLRTLHYTILQHSAHHALWQ